MKERYDDDDPRLFFGSPCKRGHRGLRYKNNGGCVDCFRARQAGMLAGVTAEETKDYLQSLRPAKPKNPVKGNGWPFQRGFQDDPTARLNFGTPGKRINEAGRHAA